jgi:hypothetical protein
MFKSFNHSFFPALFRSCKASRVYNIHNSTQVLLTMYMTYSTHQMKCLATKQCASLTHVQTPRSIFGPRRNFVSTASSSVTSSPRASPEDYKTEDETFARSLATQNIASANPEAFTQSPAQPSGPRLEDNGNASLYSIPNTPEFISAYSVGGRYFRY